MYIIIAIIILLIAIIVLSIRYFMAYAKLRSHKSYDTAASREMKRIKYHDPKINCDYCGATIDTSREKVCPNCGAEYKNDREWKERFKPDQTWVDEQASNHAAEEISTAQTEAKRIAKKLRKAIYILSSIVGVLIILGIIITIVQKQEDYAKDDELNRYSSDSYVAADYSFLGDGIVYYHEGVTISFTGIYTDENGNTKVEYHLSNDTANSLKIHAECVAVNNYADTFIYIYDNVRAHSYVKKYAQINLAETSRIKTMVFTDFKVYDENYSYSHEDSSFATLMTTEYEASNPPAATAEGNVIFENDIVTIFSKEKTDYDEYTVEVLNKTDYNLLMSCNKGMIGSKSIEVSGVYKAWLPANCLYRNIDLHSYDDSYKNRADSDEFQVSFAFTCPEHPEVDFSTGYFGIN